jgi:hypothetical protein
VCFAISLCFLRFFQHCACAFKMRVWRIWCVALLFLKFYKYFFATSSESFCRVTISFVALHFFQTIGKLLCRVVTSSRRKCYDKLLHTHRFVALLFYKIAKIATIFVTTCKKYCVFFVAKHITAHICLLARSDDAGYVPTPSRTCLSRKGHGLNMHFLSHGSEKPLE